MEMLVAFTSFHEESPVPGYSRRYLCHFADESVKEWNLCQMEHVLNSMDLTMEVSQSFRKRKAPYVLLVSDLTSATSLMNTRLL